MSPSPSVSVPCLGLCVTSIRYFAFQQNLEFGKTKDRSRSNYHFQDLKPLAPHLIIFSMLRHNKLDHLLARHFYPSLIFARKTRAHSNGAPHSCMMIF